MAHIPADQPLSSLLEESKELTLKYENHVLDGRFTRHAQAT